MMSGAVTDGPGWVATPPPAGPPTHPALTARSQTRSQPGRAMFRRRVPYTGPPSYAAPPRWGFPPLAWRWPSPLPETLTGRGPATSSVERVRIFAGHTATMLWGVATAAAIAAGGEVWRYFLLLQSRHGALSKTVVAVSDALVTTGAVLTIGMAVLALIPVLWWLFLIRGVAADLVGQAPPRTDWQVVAGLAIPGVNLVVPGAVLAEVEHTVLRRPQDARPRPSVLLRCWWAAWVVSGLLFAVTIVWRFRDGVQAQADGVLLHAAADLAAVTVAGLTAAVVRRLSTLLAPIDPASIRFQRVVRVEGAPEPPLRSVRVGGSVR